jgi:hypothetical protein
MVDKMSLRGSFYVVGWRVLGGVVVLRQWDIEQGLEFVHLMDIPPGEVFGMEDGPF